MKSFSKHCNSGLLNLKRHLLDHAIEVLLVFGSISVLNESSFEQHNVTVKHAYKQISRKSDTCTNEIVNRMERHLVR